jgi:hypothetical protein
LNEKISICWQKFLSANCFLFSSNNNRMWM